MKRISVYLTILCLLILTYSCEKIFLQMPNTTGIVQIDKVFSTYENALSALTARYRTVLGLAVTNGVEPIAMYSGEICKGQTWNGSSPFAGSGWNPSNGSGYTSITNIFSQIRGLYLVAENIDKVTDADDASKALVKAEVSGLIGHCYLVMFKTWGGVPIVTKSYAADQVQNLKRASLQETLDFALKNLDDAIAGLPDKWEDKYNGRLTKGSVMAMKAQLLLFAARPLFNSSTPYLDAGVNNNLICFGTGDPARWTTAIAASEAALAWAKANGKDIISTGGTPNINSFDDYGRATSYPNNKEMLLAYQLDNNDLPYVFNQSNNATGLNNRFNIYYGITRNQLTQYYRKDGTNQTWPVKTDAPRPATEYFAKFAQMEDRFRADQLGPGVSAENNPGNNNWSVIGWSQWGGKDFLFNNPNAAGKGCATPSKFFYKAGSKLWFEYPLFRVAELYLNLAEAYNEAGNSSKALENLNIVHNRAGLPAVTETNQANLRLIIQREWNIEFFHEAKKYYNGRHWKIANIGDGAMYGPTEEFWFNSISATNNIANTQANLTTYYCYLTYTAYWHPRMYLDPFNLSEVNKGFIVQNPGY